MKRLATTLALLALSSLAHAGTSVTTGAPAWTLYRGTSIVQPRVDHATLDACADQAKALGVARSYTCRATAGVTVAITADPPPVPTCTTPKPADETRSQACPAGTTGSWSQARSYSAAAYPMCWTAGEWIPSAAPAGSCVPVVTPPNPPGTGTGTNAGVRQGESETKVCTTRIEGKVKTYDVSSDADAAMVPWDSLQPGTAVNINHKPTAYQFKFGLSVHATADLPVVINGVTDAGCNRPVINFAGSTSAPLNTATLNAAAPQYSEGLGGIVLKRPVGSWEGPKPAFITIRGLELRGARAGATFKTLRGTNYTFSDAAAIYVLDGEDITFENLAVTDNDFGIFTQAKDETLLHAAERITIRNSRIWGNGRARNWFDHNAYIQSANPLIEGNFFGKLRDESLGSSFKDRSSRAVIRWNTFVASARAIDLVQTENNTQGIAKRPDYGTDYVYENTIISDGPEAIHFGGDNMGEQEGGGLVNPGVPYRKTLYFWNNKVTLNAGNDWWRVNVFDLSLSTTTVHAWGNTFTLGGGRSGGEFSWLQWAGQLKLGTNTVNGIQPGNARSDANPAAWSITTGNAPPTLPAGF